MGYIKVKVMKKFFSIFLIATLWILSFSGANSFLWNDSGLNLYKSIDEGYKDLDEKNFYYEAKWGRDSIKEYVNEVLKTKNVSWETSFTDWECITGEISTVEMQKISGWDLSILVEKIDPKCKENDKDITITRLNEIQQVVQELSLEAQKRAVEKTKNIYNISKIGIYSDGTTQNSAFDLIKDLQDIDKIIFTDEIEYAWEEYSDTNELYNKLFKSDKDDKKSSQLEEDKYDLEKIYLKDYLPQKEAENSNSVPDIIADYKNLQHKYACIDNSALSDQLSSSEIDKIIEQKTIKSTNSSEETIKPEPTNKTEENNNSTDENETNDENKKTSSYSPVTDNSLWPCNNFFCISIEFVMYNQNLLGWGQDISIEYLIQRSNKHLRKFVNSSLVQSEMATNNFQLSLRNLNLPDMFHMWVVIQTKPVPILKLDKNNSEEKEDKSEFSGKNLLETYYKNLGLEYQRKNDIKIFLRQEEKLKTVIDSADLYLSDFTKKKEQYNKHLSKAKAKYDLIDKAVDKKILTDDMDRFNKQFTELENFSKALFDYVNSLNAVVKNMNKIPQW